MKLIALITLALVAFAVAAPQDSFDDNVLAEIEDEQLGNGGDPSCDVNADCGTQKFGHLCLLKNPNTGKGKCRCLTTTDCDTGDTCDISGNSGAGKCKSGGGSNNDECTIATEATTCQANKPYCLENADKNKCVKCKQDSHCDEDETCVDNKCVKAPKEPKCTVANQAQKCTLDKPYCLVDSTNDQKNKCVRCTANAHCPTENTCTANNVCVPNTPAPIPCGAYDKCAAGLYCKRAGATKSCVVGCKVKYSVCKTTDNKTGKCNGAHQCIVPAKKRGSPCSKKVVNDCGTGFKCVTKFGYKGACHKVVAAGATCGKGRFPDLCPTGSKCKYHKCTIPVVIV